MFVHMQIQGSWEKKLIEKVMHNAYWKQHKRSIDDDDSSDSSAPKRKRGRPSTSQVLTRYPPLRDTGEDEVAGERNRQQLQRELEKDRPRKETILLLAKQTFTSRRSEILDESKEISASSILSKYGEIQKPYVVSKQTNTITFAYNFYIFNNFVLTTITFCTYLTIDLSGDGFNIGETGCV